MVVFSSGQTVEQLNKIHTVDVENRFSGWIGVFIHGKCNSFRNTRFYFYDIFFVLR